MSILLVFAFLSGLITIASPCIWPLLPIVLSATATGGHKKPLGVTLGIISSFAIFTLTLSYVVKIIPLDTNALRLFAVIVIGFLGVALIIPKLSQLLEGFVSRLSGRFGTTGNQQTGFWSGFITGFTLGIVWAPCAGPILATIATLAATTQVNAEIVLVTIAYSIGIAIPLFLFATLGRQVFYKSKVFSKYTSRVQQIFGIVMVLTAIAIYTNYDKSLEANLLNAFPSYTSFLTSLESNQSIKKELQHLKQNKNSNPLSNMFPSGQNSDLLNTNYPAPEFTGITKWLNPEKPLSLKDLRGKVVLVDFWTYTCINCIRTLPFVTSWYDKYKDQGFVVIGVHTPEFEFEKDTKNVQQAIKQFSIHYPVAQDNNYATWNAYNNQYWPAEYLIDKDGNVRRTHFGEGEYDQTERAIQLLLKEAGKSVSDKTIDMPDQTPHMQLSPETYVGAKRMEYFAQNGSVDTGRYKFTLVTNLPDNTFSFGGEWRVEEEFATALVNPLLSYNFYANKVFLVLSPPDNKKGEIVVFLDGKKVDEKNAGIDVKGGVVIVDQQRLYNLIDLHGKSGRHILKLEFQTPGTSAYTFTFG